MPGGGTRYQLDYILVKKRYQNQVKQSKSFPGADIHSDHNLVIMESSLSLKKMENKQISKKKWYLDKLKDKETRYSYSEGVNNKLKELKELQIKDRNEPYGINDDWEALKEAATTAAETKLGTEKNTPIRPWITNKIVDLIEERRKYKNGKNDEDKRKYKVYRNMIIRESKKAKEEWLNDKCSSVDDCLSKGMGDKAYKLMKRFFSDYRNRSTFLKNSDGKVISDEEEKLKTPEDMQYNTGPPILREEFEIALKELKSNKAPGIDELNGELLKALDGYRKDILFRIIGKAYKSGIFPKDFEKCIIDEELTTRIQRHFH
ncbi:hypothetical protein QTP88_029229 [Uroleucon formosanum]